MLFTKAVLSFSSFIFLVSAQEPQDALRKSLNTGLSRSPNPSFNRMLMTRDVNSLNKRCTGSCAECFGDGYTGCPGSSIYCYKPGDLFYGLESCLSTSSGSSTATSTASAAGSTSTSGTGDLCYDDDATCTSCFGPTYFDCPDGYHCYDPNDPQYDTCPDNSTDTDNSSACASQFGVGSVPCGEDSCYNPDEGDVCCGEDGCKFD
jgi:hypothetical protein